MTTVVAAETKEGVVFASDSQTSFGSRKEYSKKGKIVSNGGIVFAFTGAVKVKNVLEHMTFPTPPKSRNRAKLEKWLVNTLTPKIRKELRDREAIDFDRGEANMGSAIVVAVNGRLFEISSDFAVTTNETRIYALGSGGSIAIGALYAGATPVQAVQIATFHDAFSGGDIHEMMLKKEKKGKK